MCSEEYSVTWSGHQKNVVEMFGRFFDESALVDCTIAAEGMYLKAHRLMLSACSPYFERLFCQEKRDKVVVLEDMKFEDLKSLMVFVYQGQVNVPKDRLQDFVSAAKSLQIRGLPMDRISNEMSTWENEESDNIVRASPSSAVVDENNPNKRTPVDTASTTPFVPSIPTEQIGGELGDVFSRLQAKLAERLCTDNETVVMRTSETVSAIVSPCSESTVEPMHKVWVKEMPLCEDEDEIVETVTGDIHTQGTLNEKLDNFPVGSSSRNLEVSPSTCMAVQSNENKVNQLKMEEPEMTHQHMEHQCESIGVNDNAADRVVEREQPAALEFYEEHVVDEEEMVEGEIENTLEPGLSEKLSGEEEGAAQISNCISESSGKKSPKGPERSEVIVTVHRLQAHMKEVLREERSNRCEVCRAAFAYSSQLEVHMLKHSRKRPFRCETCKVSFARRSQLITHMRRHTGERPFECEVCKKSFCEKSNLTKHMQLHTSEPPLQCDVCKLFFTQSSQFNAHMQKHTGERPFQCDVCKMSFDYMRGLTVHMRRHTRERPYKCGACNMSFSDRDNRNKHMRTHTGKHDFQCDVCNAAFKYKDILSNHMQKHRVEHLLSVSGM